MNEVKVKCLNCNYEYEVPADKANEGTPNFCCDECKKAYEKAQAEAAVIEAKTTSSEAEQIAKATGQ